MSISKEPRPVTHAARRLSRLAVGSGLVALAASSMIVSAGSAVADTTSTQSVPTTIASDCSVDVSTALSQWLGSRPSGTTVQFPTGGCYEVDGHLVLTNRTNLTLQGNGATLQAKRTNPNSAAMLQLVGGSNITVTGLTIIGTNPSPTYNSNQEWSAGIKIFGGNQVVLNNLTIQHVYGDFVTVGTNNKTPSQGIVIQNSHFDTAGRQGIALTDASQVHVNNVTLGNTGADTFDLESNSPPQGVSNVLIENTTSFGKGAVWFSAGGNANSNTGNVLVRNNTMTSTQAGDVVNLWAPVGYAKDKFTFTGNTFYAGASTTVSALQLTRTSNLKFDNNVINFANRGKSSDYTHEAAIYAYQSLNVEASGNMFYGVGNPVVKSSQSTVFASNNQSIA